MTVIESNMRQCGQSNALELTTVAMGTIPNSKCSLTLPPTFKAVESKPIRILPHRPSNEGKKSVVLLLLLTHLFGLQIEIQAAAGFYWTNYLGGLYSDTSNWSPNAMPLPSDSVMFTNASPYIFTVDVGVTNASALFFAGTVTQAISSNSWFLTNEWRVGELAGNTSRVTLVSGNLTVTNDVGTGVLSVGRIGTGELAFFGGNVVTDFLQASDGSKSILTCDHGSLTTYHGSVVSNSSQLLILGTAPNDTFTWNIAGGTNRILNYGRNSYGGLTLGGSGSAIVNCSGLGTTLSVDGLDTYGNNKLCISGGALFQTKRVQLGISSGASNVVVIADSGSTWLNTSLMYFGMHQGQQTLIITNGGLFTNASYSDLTFLANTGGNRIIVTGSNSLFYSAGTANAGLIWGIIPGNNLNNLILITNGGKFFAKQLTYGQKLSSFSIPGTLLNVADGNLWIGSLSFAVGTLRIEAGTGTIDQLSMTGGTNSLIQTYGNLYFGHHGNLGPGELKIGANSTITSLDGQLEVGGWQIGTFSGDSGNVTMVGGRAFVTNASHTASLVVGSAGSGTLCINTGYVQADVVKVSAFPGSFGSLILDGPTSSLFTPNLAVNVGGTIMVNNKATLQVSNCIVPASSISVNGAMLEFLSGTTSLSSNSITATNATFSFRNVSDAQVDLSNPNFFGCIKRYGSTVLRLVQTTNTPIPSIAFRANDASTWSRLILNEGTSAVQVGSILIDANSSLAATNATTTISGSFTNRGSLILSNSTLRFTGPAVWSKTAAFQATQGRVIFTGGLHLPDTDVVVPPGVAVQVSSITSDGGRLIINGGSIIPNDDGTVPSGVVLLQNGWVTYYDTPAAPLVPPTGLTGALGVELIRSTNASIISATFGSGTGGYERLRMGNGSCWQSQQLVISRGGSLSIADPSASIILTSGIFLAEQGGVFSDDTGGTNHVGFSPTSFNASATVSGNGSTWSTTNAISIGAGGSQNQLLIAFGGNLVANSATIGGSSGNSNRLALSGIGASCSITNSLSVVGTQSQLIVQTAAVFRSSQILASGSSARISLVGTGAVAYCSTQIILSGYQAKLQVFGGANFFTSNATLNASGGTLAEISDQGSLWNLTGKLTISPSISSYRPNVVLVSNKAAIVCPSLTLTSPTFGRAALVIQSGQLYVTNSTGTASLVANGPLDLNGGFLRADNFVANNASAAVINLRAGQAEWITCELAAGIPLRIGDGTNFISLKLLGGTNNCQSGFEVCQYSALTGSGVILGAVTNRGWMRPSAITIRNNLVLASTSELDFTLAGGPDFPQNSSLVITGSISLAGKIGISIASGAGFSNSQSYLLIQSTNIASSFSNVVFGQRLLTSDRLASFRIDKTGAGIIATDFQSEDLDGDGIQDSWAIQHFGVSPLLPGKGKNDLDGDWDGDGLSNRNEFRLGTDPRNPSSSLAIQVGATGPSGINLRFQHIPGFTYYIGSSPNLVNWTYSLIEQLRFDSTGLAEWSDMGTNVPTQRFFHLLVQ